MSGDWFGLAHDESDGKFDLALFGVPYDGSVFFQRGAAEAPRVIRSLSSKLPPASEDGRALDRLRVRDLGDVEVLGSDRTAMDERSRILWHAARTQGLPLAIGGDHSISIPLFAAAGEWAQREFGVLWIDAHPDLCDRYQDSPTSHACVLRRALESPFLRPENVIMIGTRSCELEEIEYLRTHPVTVITAEAAAHRAAREVSAELTRRFTGMPVYLSIDIDALDPAHAPGTGIPDAGGLSARWLLDLLHGVAGLELLAIDLVEVAPPLDVPSNPTALLALKMILELLAGRL